jgi:hypothetical protein
VVVLGIIAGAIFFVLLGSTTKPEVVTTTSPSPSVTAIATKEEVQQDLATADARLKEAATDQAAAKAAAKDSTNQIKVGS